LPVYYSEVLPDCQVLDGNLPLFLEFILCCTIC